MTRFALVTGGSRGIGAGIAERLTNDGYDVIIADRIEPTHGFLKDFISVDLADPEKAAGIVLEKLAGRDVLRFVHNAGILLKANLDEIKIADVNKELAINTVSLISLAQILLPAMKRNNFGRIVAIASRATLGKAGRTGYAASKAAMRGIARSWALELGRNGITINLVSPGPVPTALLNSNNPLSDPFTKKLLYSVPVGFVGSPADIANAVAFFLADEARFITGQDLFVCGGVSIGFVEPAEAS